MAPLFIPGQSWSHAGTPDIALYKFATSSLAWEATQCVGIVPSPLSNTRKGRGNNYVILGGSASADFSLVTRVDPARHFSHFERSIPSRLCQVTHVELSRTPTSRSRLVNGLKIHDHPSTRRSP